MLVSLTGIWVPGNVERIEYSMFPLFTGGKNQRVYVAQSFCDDLGLGWEQEGSAV